MTRGVDEVCGPPNVPPLSSGRIRKPEGHSWRRVARRWRSRRSAAVCFNGLLGGTTPPYANLPQTRRPLLGFAPLHTITHLIHLAPESVSRFWSGSSQTMRPRRSFATAVAARRTHSWCSSG